jgi:hypothetical protein
MVPYALRKLEWFQAQTIIVLQSMNWISGMFCTAFVMNQTMMILNLDFIQFVSFQYFSDP